MFTAKLNFICGGQVLSSTQMKDNYIAISSSDSERSVNIHDIFEVTSSVPNCYDDSVAVYSDASYSASVALNNDLGGHKFQVGSASSTSFIPFVVFIFNDFDSEESYFLQLLVGATTYELGEIVLVKCSDDLSLVIPQTDAVHKIIWSPNGDVPWTLNLQNTIDTATLT